VIPVAYAMPEQEVTASMVKRVVRQVTSKRQVTIPKEFFEAIGIGELIELALDDEAKAIIIHPYKMDDWRVPEHIIEDLAAEGVPAEKMAAAFSGRKAEIEAAIGTASTEVDAELQENPNAGEDYIAARLKELGQDER